MDSLYSINDLNILKSNLPDIHHQIKYKQNSCIKPYFDERIKVHNIILQYII